MKFKTVELRCQVPERTLKRLDAVCEAKTLPRAAVITLALDALDAASAPPAPNPNTARGAAALKRQEDAERKAAADAKRAAIQAFRESDAGKMIARCMSVRRGSVALLKELTSDVGYDEDMCISFRAEDIPKLTRLAQHVEEIGFATWLDAHKRGLVVSLDLIGWDQHEPT